MMGIVKTYRNKTHASISLIGLLSWFFSFSLQSCSIRGGELNINSIPIERLQRNLASYVNGCIPRETRAKFQRLQEEGFLGRTAPDFRDIQNNNDVRKHFMFLFYHCLNLKEPGVMFRTANERDEFVNNFRRIPGSAMLFWEPIRVDRNSNRRPYTVEFRIKDLLINFRGLRDLNESGNLDDSGNLNVFALANIQNRHAPEYLGDIVEIDHLFRDNSILAELPGYIHNQKTILIDNLMRVPRQEQVAGLIRESGNYWVNRADRGRA